MWIGLDRRKLWRWICSLNASGETFLIPILLWALLGMHLVSSVPLPTTSAASLSSSLTFLPLAFLLSLFAGLVSLLILSIWPKFLQRNHLVQLFAGFRQNHMCRNAIVVRLNFPILESGRQVSTNNVLIVELEVFIQRLVPVTSSELHSFEVLWWCATFWDPSSNEFMRMATNAKAFNT